MISLLIGTGRFAQVRTIASEELGGHRLVTTACRFRSRRARSSGLCLPFGGKEDTRRSCSL